MSDQYYDEDNVSEIFSRVCECGHELYRHASTMQHNYSTGQQYLRVSQCTGPDEVGNEHFCSCKQFKAKE